MFLRSLFVLLLLPAAASAQQTASHADRLPASTLFYFEIPDVAALKSGLGQGAVGRIWSDAEVQGFVGPMVQMGTEQYDMAMAALAENGMPVQFFSWDAMKSISVGFAMDGGAVPNGFGMLVSVELRLAEGMGEAAFALLQPLLQQAGPADLAEGEGGAQLRIEPAMEGAPALELMRSGDILHFRASNMPVASSSLGASASFQRARREVMKPGMACFGFYNPVAALDMQRSFLGFSSGGDQLESMADAMMSFAESAMGNAQAISFSSGWKDGDSVSASYIDFGGKPAGWAYSAKPADRGLVQYVPATATAFSLSSMGGGEGIGQLFTGIDEVLADESMQQTIAIWEGAEPISHSWFVGENRPLLDAALRGFGERMVSYSTPTESRTLIELTDPAAVQAAATPLVKTIAQLMDSIDGFPVALRARRESPRANPQQSVPIYYLRLKTEALPPQFAQISSMFLSAFEPSFAVSPDGWLVLSGTRTSVRSVIRSGLQPEAQTIQSNPEARSFLERVPEAAVKLSWSDPRPSVTQMMAYAQVATGFIGMQANPEDLPFDLTKMPSADAINSHLHPSESFAWRDEAGMKTWSQGSFGMADFFAVAGYALPMSAMAFAYMAPSQAGPQVMEMVPPPPPPVADDPTEQTYNELARLQTGVRIYSIMNSELPADLQALLSTGPEDQPYLDAPAAGLRPDGWGHAFVYRLTTDGFMLYSVGPNGQDEGGQGDDLSVDN